MHPSLKLNHSLAGIIGEIHSKQRQIEVQERLKKQSSGTQITHQLVDRNIAALKLSVLMCKKSYFEISTKLDNQINKM